jgi:hypothetical protein
MSAAQIVEWAIERLEEVTGGSDWRRREIWRDWAAVAELFGSFLKTPIDSGSRLDL